MKTNPVANIALLGLPNLFLRSMITLSGLYMLLVAFLIALVEFVDLDILIAVVIGVFAILFQFVVGPWLMDLQLRWMFTTEKLSPSQLPDHLNIFVEQLCQKHQIKYPSFILIKDGAPQAFTYGHTPNNARVVISQGILNLLKPEEIQAVVAHELGHVVHWDMLLMTMAQLVPLMLYYLFKTLSKSRDGGNGKGKGAVLIAALVAYILYIICEYIVLFFSRTREYHADRFAGWETGNPSYLANALIKIAYGLAGQEEYEGSYSQRDPKMAAVSAMGIFDVNTAQALAISSYPGPNKEPNQANIEGAMYWDLWNPWAQWFELNSTHPLVAHRLRYLSNQSQHMGLAPYIVFNQPKPESYWDEFLIDLIIYLFPRIIFFLILAVFIIPVPIIPFVNDDVIVSFLVSALGLGLLIRYYFSYPELDFPDYNVAGLLNQIEVSHVRPIACTVKGKVIGRGIPGYILSEDFVMQDETGIIFLDLRQPLMILEMMFAILKAGSIGGKEVTARGWYHRAPVPYVELLTLSYNGKEHKSWVPFCKKTIAILLIIGGMIWSCLTM